jgi:ABC-2 type transport system permease protein
MPKLWRVALYEYQRRVFRRSFLLILLSLPALIALMVIVGVLAGATTTDTEAVGYVDHAGFLVDPMLPPQREGSPDDPAVGKLVPLLPFPTESEAEHALQNGAIQAYYVIATDYAATARVDLVYIDYPGWNVTQQFWDFMQINQLRDLAPETARRAVAGTDLIIRWPEDSPGGAREFSQATFFSNLLPLVVPVLFVFLLFSSSGYLMNAVVEEKENQTMEVLMTSLSANQLMIGKVVGIVAITLTQAVGWALFAVLGVLIGGRFLGISALENVTIDPGLVMTTAAISAPVFVMLAALMTAVGATMARAEEAQQVTGIFMLPFMVPLWLLQPILEDSNASLAVILSLFPPTSVTTLSVRTAFGQVPQWQTIASFGLSTACAAGAMWIAGRAFRLGMLRYGKPLSLRELLPRRAPRRQHEIAHLTEIQR